MSSGQTYKAIVMGTSAGGLYVLQSLLEALPADYPLPVVVVQHRSRDQRNLLEEVLQSRCAINIKQADEKEQVSGGNVYLAPPDYHLLLERDHTFSLASDEPVRYSRPSIDVLFESAAMAYGKHLVGIILTGANSDGAEGIRAIKKSGGLTLAQDPETALFPVMPRAAIETGHIDRVLPLADIGHFLLNLPLATKK